MKGKVSFCEVAGTWNPLQTASFFPPVRSTSPPNVAIWSFWRPFVSMFDKEFIAELAKAIAVEVAKILETAPKVQPRYLNLEQAAVYLNTTKDGVRGMARAKVFPIKKAGTRTFIDIHDIDTAMQENTAWAAMELEAETVQNEEIIPHSLDSEEQADEEPHS
jgi:hypothetical protein